MICVDSLSFGYDGNKVLEDISLKIESGTTTAFIGPSGCGKTTLIYLLAGLLPCSKGEITINGDQLNGLRNDAGIILQSYGLFPWKTVQQNILLGTTARKIPKKAAIRKTIQMMKKLNLESVQDKFPHELSGGQRQRAAIGRTLVMSPNFLLMDEASSALDAITKEKTQNLILDLYHETQMTLVFVTHSIEEAVFLGQKIVVMDHGNIKTIVNNEGMGAQNYRQTQTFFEKCVAVRQALEEKVEG